VSHAILIGSPAEMTEVRVERLGAGDHEEHRATRQEPDIATAEEKAHAVKGIERREHAQFCATCQAPPMASTANHTSVMGPKKGGDPCSAP
jgi:hypothetical protein